MKKFITLLLIFTFIHFFSPFTCLAQSQTELWGMTMGGGNGGGVIYKTAGDGTNQQLIRSFIDNPGQYPEYANLCQASNGKFYGMTYAGGMYDIGVLFEYDPSTFTYTKKLDFEGATNGSSPFGSLMQASNGKLYGMARTGGANNFGVLFEYDPATNTYTKKLDFAGTTNGQYPTGSLIQASNGKLYGMTPSGGTNNYGVIFEYDPTTSIYTKRLDFAWSAYGFYPLGSLLQASNGKVYGMTNKGGANNYGVIFEIDPSTTTYIKKLDFAGASNGSYPPASLMQASNEKLYGMTPMGGANGLGVLFEYDPATSTYTKKLDFAGASNGSYPQGSLMQASNGKLYGTTSGGGGEKCRSSI
jgi:uncharacterized repeat protein (TIGR03803 family)